MGQYCNNALLILELLLIFARRSHLLKRPWTEQRERHLRGGGGGGGCERCTSDGGEKNSMLAREFNHLLNKRMAELFRSFRVSCREFA